MLLFVFFCDFSLYNVFKPYYFVFVNNEKNSKIKNHKTPASARTKVYESAMLLRSALVDLGFSDAAIHFLDASLFHIGNDCKEAHFGRVNVLHEQPKEIADMFVKHGIMPVNINMKGE